MSDTAHGNISISASSQSLLYQLDQFMATCSCIFICVCAALFHHEDWLSCIWAHDWRWKLLDFNSTMWLVDLNITHKLVTFTPKLNHTMKCSYLQFSSTKPYDMIQSTGEYHNTIRVKFAQVTNHRVGKNSMVCIGEKRRSYVHIWLIYNLFSFFFFLGDEYI